MRKLRHAESRRGPSDERRAAELGFFANVEGSEERRRRLSDEKRAENMTLSNERRAEESLEERRSIAELEAAIAQVDQSAAKAKKQRLAEERRMEEADAVGGLLALEGPSGRNPESAARSAERRRMEEADAVGGLLALEGPSGRNPESAARSAERRRLRSVMNIANVTNQRLQGPADLLALGLPSQASEGAARSSRSVMNIANITNQPISPREALFNLQGPTDLPAFELPSQAPGRTAESVARSAERRRTAMNLANILNQPGPAAQGREPMGHAKGRGALTRMRASPRWFNETGSRNIPWGVYAEGDEFDSPSGVGDEQAWVYRREINPVAGPCPAGTHAAPGYKRFDSDDYCVRDCQFWDPPRYMARKANDGRCIGKIPDGSAGGRRRVAREGGARRALTAYNVYTQRVNASVKNMKPIEITRSAAFREGWNNIKLIAFNARETAFEAMDREAGQGVVRNVIRSLGGGRSAHRSPYIDIEN